MTTETMGRGQEWPAAAARAAARWLHLAAAPTFGVMALYASFGSDAPDMCATMHQASPLNGMALMYLLMSAFHLAPWLKLISGRIEPQQGAPSHLGTSVFLIARQMQGLAPFRGVDRSLGARRIRHSFHRRLTRGTAR